MATVQIFNSFKEAVAEKVHNFQTDALHYMFSNTAPLLTNSIKANIAEITAGGGYTTGGNVVPVLSSVQTGGIYSLQLDASTFTATTGFGPFRYIVLYNNTATNDELIGFVDYGASYTLPASQPFTIQACTFLTNA